jgi:hypothetical protein
METIESFFTLRDEYFRAYLIVHNYIGGLWRRGTLRSGLLAALLIWALGLAQPLQAAEFTCASGNVACLIDAVNQANANGEANRIRTMDELARKYVETHDPEIIKELYQLALELEKMEKLEKQ